MSKKKQLTGKKTKLAKLPLTQALSANLGEEAWEPPTGAAASLEAAQPQLPLSWEQVEVGAQGLLAAAYVLIVKEITALQAMFADGRGDHPLPYRSDEPAGTPDPPAVRRALRLIKADLGDLAHILSA